MIVLRPAEALLQVETFPHEPLQAGFVEDVVGEFFVGEHGESGALGSRDEFRSFFNSKVRVLTDDRHHHVDHHLEAADLLRFLQSFIWLRIFHCGKGPSPTPLSTLQVAAHSRHIKLDSRAVPTVGIHSARFKSAGQSTIVAALW